MRVSNRYLKDVSNLKADLTRVTGEIIAIKNDIKTHKKNGLPTAELEQQKNMLISVELDLRNRRELQRAKYAVRESGLEYKLEMAIIEVVKTSVSASAYRAIEKKAKELILAGVL